MNKLMNNINAAFTSEAVASDDAGFIDDLLFIVGIALAAVAVGGWVSGAAMNKGADIAACIEGTSITTGAATSSTCANTHSTGTKKLSTDANYKSRYPTGK